MLKRKPAKENYQMLPFSENTNEPRHSNINFESAGEVLMDEDD